MKKDSLAGPLKLNKALSELVIWSGYSSHFPRLRVPAGLGFHEASSEFQGVHRQHRLLHPRYDLEYGQEGQ